MDYKKLDYKIKNLIPGPHVTRVKKIAKQSAVPILVHDHNIIQNSSDIISYLDRVFPQFTLTPSDADLETQALEWEAYVDKEIGIPLRLFCYHVLLEYPALAIPLFVYNGPWYGNLLMRVIFPKLRDKMHKAMDINDKTAQFALKRLRLAIDKVQVKLKDRRFFVGEQFSRADLATASLLAPFCRPNKYGIDWPKKYPDELEEVIADFWDKICWVSAMYQEFR